MIAVKYNPTNVMFKLTPYGLMQLKPNQMQKNKVF